MLLAISVPETVWFSNLCARKGRVLKCQMCARKGRVFLKFALNRHFMINFPALRVKFRVCTQFLDCNNSGISIYFSI